MRPLGLTKTSLNCECKWVVCGSEIVIWLAAICSVMQMQTESWGKKRNGGEQHAKNWKAGKLSSWPKLGKQVFNLHFKRVANWAAAVAINEPLTKVIAHPTHRLILLSLSLFLSLQLASWPITMTAWHWVRRSIAWCATQTNLSSCSAVLLGRMWSCIGNRRKVKSYASTKDASTSSRRRQVSRLQVAGGRLQVKGEVRRVCSLWSVTWVGNGLGDRKSQTRRGSKGAKDYHASGTTNKHN